MFVSARSDYALRAMLAVAASGGGGELVKAASLAEAQDIPLSFLQGILLDLRRAGLLHSHRGADGGYWLAVSPIDITYGDLIRVMRGSLALVPCASRFAHEKCANCVEEGECRTRALMLQVRDRTAELLDSIRLSDPIELVPADSEAAES